MKISIFIFFDKKLEIVFEEKALNVSKIRVIFKGELLFETEDTFALSEDSSRILIEYFPITNISDFLDSPIEDAPLSFEFYDDKNTLVLEEEYARAAFIDKAGLIVVNGVLRSPLSLETEEIDTTVKSIAFYLPQFYPFDENDEWWGTGFTEWHNVASARPHFTGHAQPNLPSDLGFYDLRLRQTRDKQAQLAQEYGIDGFCYYYYWFSGHRLMGEVVDDVLRSGSPDFPYCLCWANEPWSRRWDGSEQEVLMPQEHDPDVDKGFIRDLLPHFRDPRYIKTADNRPVLVIYRTDLMEKLSEVVREWVTVAQSEGFNGLYLIEAQTFRRGDESLSPGFDAALQFPPHAAPAARIDTASVSHSEIFDGDLFDYKSLVAEQLRRPQTPFTLHPGVMPAWDNTPRKGNKGTAYINSSPEVFSSWVTDSFRRAENNPAEAQFVFVNSWNEWAEGAQLEPDMSRGRERLSAFRDGRKQWELRSSDPETRLKNIEVENEILKSERVAQFDYQIASFRPMHQLGLDIPPAASWGDFHAKLDNEDFYSNDALLNVRKNPLFHVKGWSTIQTKDGLVACEAHEILFSFHHIKQMKTFFVRPPSIIYRKDVFDALEADEDDQKFGFDFYGDISALPKGFYSFEVLCLKYQGSYRKRLLERIFIEA